MVALLIESGKMKQTRLTITIFLILVQAYVTIVSLHLEMANVTIIALGSITATGAAYKILETKRPSKKKDNENA